MAKYAHDTIVPFKESNLDKKQQVATMFDRIAFKYDFLNRFLSAGIDVSWRKKAINVLKENRPQNILDVATGTADVAILCHKLLHPQKITGIDISAGMLEIGRSKVKKLGLENCITLVKGDGETINFPDNSFDAITVAFGVRNFEHLETGLQEMYRVLKPGGQMVVLEFSRPKNVVIKKLYNFYMDTVAPNFGNLFAKNKDAYQYLNDSAQKFPEREQFAEILKNTGYKNILIKPLTLGICCIYSVLK